MNNSERTPLKYSFVNPNTDYQVQEMLKTIIVEKVMSLNMSCLKKEHP